MDRFDWYSATIKQEPGEVLEGLREGLGGTLRPSRGMHAYRQGVEVIREGDVVARALWDGSRDDMHPHAWASGDATEEFVEVVRARWPTTHYCTRVDSAADFKETGGWERLFAAAKRVKEHSRVKGRLILPDDLRDGRTYYLGAPSSDVRMRLYEKGAQVLGQRCIEAGTENPLADWVRAEVQIRPGPVAREAVARMTAAEVWGCSPWVKSLAMEIRDMEVKRFKMHQKKETNLERAYRFMLLQYGSVLRQMHEDQGGWDVVGLQIGHDLEHVEDDLPWAA